MTTLTEAIHAGAFVVTDQGTYSYDEKVLVSGQNLAAGTVVMNNGSGKMTVYTAGDATDGGTQEAAGILFAATDASGGDMPCTILARDAEVLLSQLTYPNSLTDNSDETNTVTSLGYIGIIARS